MKTEYTRQRSFISKKYSCAMQMHMGSVDTYQPFFLKDEEESYRQQLIAEVLRQAQNKEK